MNFTQRDQGTLYDYIFRIHDGIPCDELRILSAYISAEPISRLQGLPIKTEVIYGLAKENLSEKLHNKLLTESCGSGEDVFYAEQPSHAKIYIWLNKGEIQMILSGSANFSIQGLCTPLREVLAPIHKNSFAAFKFYYDTIKESAHQAKAFNYKEKHSMDIDSGIRLERRNIDPNQFESDSLFSPASKINWGHGRAKNKPGDAYIPIRMVDCLAYPHLFPAKLNGSTLKEGKQTLRDNDPIEVLWDDGESMRCLLEGSQTKRGLSEKFPNKISSFNQKNTLGNYLRRRMGLKKDVFVSEEDFKRYGRDSIGIKLISRGLYEFDFSPNTK